MGAYYNWQLSRIGKEYSFCAAHKLPMVDELHPCYRLHGHNYIVEIEIRGEIAPNGFCNGVDFNTIDKEMKPLIDKLDHQYLNDFIDNPTAENIAKWFLDNIKTKIYFSVKVWETPKCWAMVIANEGLFKKVHRE
jgi:6-pyruvoyltetrahydropterin/6-carboxytetrahydropterin synthase